MLDAFQKSECKVSVKMHFLHLHLNYFLDNCGMFSEEQGKRFYQEITVMEERYKGQWNVNMIADYCWYLKRENSSECARKSGRHAFSMIKIPMLINIILLTVSQMLSYFNRLLLLLIMRGKIFVTILCKLCNFLSEVHF